MFTTDLLTKYTWTGVSKDKSMPEKKSFSSLDAVNDLIFEVLRKADDRWTRKDNENIFKDGILKHAKKRNQRQR